MDAPDDRRLLAAMDATWPPAETAVLDGWRLRRGEGGGKRVSAASPEGVGGELAPPEAAMRAWGQPPLFRLTRRDSALDRDLARRGYALVDPVVLRAAPLETLADGRDETARVIRVSTPLALVDDLWAAGGIGPARRAVMARAAGPKIMLLTRLGDRPAGVAFVALDGDVAMLHAVEVLAGHRRSGAGEALTRGAASFAADYGARWLALAVTEDNGPARALYEKLGMAEAGRYHYRILND